MNAVVVDSLAALASWVAVLAVLLWRRALNRRARLARQWQWALDA
jgi:hypothetical protein